MLNQSYGSVNAQSSHFGRPLESFLYNLELKNYNDYFVLFQKEIMHLHWSRVLAFMAILRCSTANQMIYGTAELEHDWTEAFKLIIKVKMQYPVSDGWRMALIFSQPIKKIDVWRAKWLDSLVSEDKMMHPLKELHFTKRLAKGQVLTFAVVAYKCEKNRPPGNVTVLFKGGNIIPRLPTEPPVSSTTHCWDSRSLFFQSM